MIEKIELLPVELLDQNRSLVVELKKLASSLGLDFGWHYLLDLTWTISQLGSIENRRILDAGAGTGILQWYLAEHGAQVVSVDRFSRSLLPVRFRRRYRCQGLRPTSVRPMDEVRSDLDPIWKVSRPTSVKMIGRDAVPGPGAFPAWPGILQVSLSRRSNPVKSGFTTRTW